MDSWPGSGIGHILPNALVQHINENCLNIVFKCLNLFRTLKSAILSKINVKKVIKNDKKVEHLNEVDKLIL